MLHSQRVKQYQRLSFGLLGPISSVISFDFCYLLISSGWQNPCKILKVVHAWGKINFMWCFLKKPQLYHDLAVLYIGCSAAEDIQFYKEKKKNNIFFIAKTVVHFRYGCLSFTFFIVVLFHRGYVLTKIYQ